MKFKLFFIFTLVFSLPLCAITQALLNKYFLQAALLGELDTLKSYLLKGANVDAIDTRYSGGVTALKFAIITGNIEMVKLLLEYHVNVNARDKDGHTPLMHAVVADQSEIVKLLLEYHADINAHKNGFTALAYAIIKEDTHIINILLKHGVNINAPVHEPLKYVTKKNNPRIIELLLNHINHILDKTEPEMCQYWDRYILDALREPRYFNPIDTINAFRMFLHHAGKLPLSRKKLESLTIRAFRQQRYGEIAFRETIKHLRKNAF